MNDMLFRILADKRAEVGRRKAEKSFHAIDEDARVALSLRGFARALQNKVTQGRVGLIAEIKKASPSGGMIRPVFDPVALAQAYERGGAACLSVLTDEPYFQGRDEDLIAARAACALPVLRKDFMIDPWQVAEARAIGADCILLILAALEDSQAQELHAAATGYGMDVLIEVHDCAEMERALRLPSGLIGINNRNLKTLTTDLATTDELAPLVPQDRLTVSESGIKTPADIARIRARNVHCFLVGESLLRLSDVGAGVSALIGDTAL